MTPMYFHGVSKTPNRRFEWIKSEERIDKKRVGISKIADFCRMIPKTALFNPENIDLRPKGSPDFLPKPLAIWHPAWSDPQSPLIFSEKAWGKSFFFFFRSLSRLPLIITTRIYF